MTGPALVSAVCAGANLAFAALNAYMFVASGHHWYSAAVFGLSVGSTLFCLWLAVKQ